MSMIRDYINNRFDHSDTDAENVAMRNFIDSAGYELKKTGDGVYEVVKKTSADVGDYLNPIFYVSGMEIDAGKWYTDGDDIWEAIKTGVPSEWEDPEYFDVIM